MSFSIVVFTFWVAAGHLMKNTELNLIPIFVAIFEERNLSRAANRLDITQPAVSKALARLRDMYDDPLFHRSSAGVKPTTFSIDIYPDMARSLKSFQATLESSIAFDPKTSSRVFSIACISAVSYGLLPLVMKNIRDVAPNISLEVHPLYTEDYEADLRHQRYDLIIDMPPDNRSRLQSELLYEDRLMVFCREDHPRIGDSISMEQFLFEDHATVSRWHNRRNLMTKFGVTELEHRKVTYSAPGVFEIFPVLMGSDLLALLPERTVKQFQINYPVKKIEFPWIDDKVDIGGLFSIWHPNRQHDPSNRWLRKQVKIAADTLNKQ